ncbi:hypothetical protein HMPREF0020_02283 [Acinetobacter baumannii 6013113]|nr:hypothetical protein HMPREF0020_02283 [Acinetobacter baumannii 6013113]
MFDVFRAFRGEGGIERNFLQHTQQVVQLAVFGAFAFMVVLLQIGSEAQSCPLSAGWEAVMIFP